MRRREDVREALAEARAARGHGQPQAAQRAQAGRGAPKVGDVAQEVARGGEQRQSHGLK